MQTVIKQFEVYEFDELSEESQEAAIQKYLENDEFLEYENYFESIKKFNELLPSKVNFEFTSLSIEGYYGNDYKIDISEEYDNLIAELSGVRLWKWLINNKVHLIRTKYKTGKRKVRNEDWENKPKIYEPLKVVNLCKKDAKFQYALTECYTDYSVLKVLHEFLQKPNKNMTLEDLLEKTASSIIETLIEEGEHFYSDERVKESLINNDYKFLEDGSIYS